MTISAFLHIDGRSAASTESQFDEDAVRRAILDEKFPEAMKTYMAKLREDAYIKVNEYLPSDRLAAAPYRREKGGCREGYEQDQGSTRLAMARARRSLKTTNKNNSRLEQVRSDAA